MSRSMKLGHCVCNPRQGCPCDTFKQYDVCQCAGEKLRQVLPDDVRLTQVVRKAGCASKISQEDLKKVIAKLPLLEDARVLVGVNTCDDAGVIRLNETTALVQTVDVFAPVVDDPYTFGRICAANSLSDVYAMGGVPVSALAIIGFPIESMNSDIMAEILRGGSDAMREADVAIVGGHSINDEELKCGYAVTGTIDPARIMSNDRAQAGDALVLTKPIGTGVVAFAAQIGRAPADLVEYAQHSMASLNKTASELMVACGAHACTDVTGFGLAGHLGEMARQSKVSARIDISRVPFFAGAVELARQGVMGGGVDSNRAFTGNHVHVEESVCEEVVHLLFDAQTSGGLLVSLDPAKADDFVKALQAAGIAEACVVGEMAPAGEWAVRIKQSTKFLNLHGPELLPGDPAGNPQKEPIAFVQGAVRSQAESMSCCAEPMEEKPLLDQPPASSSRIQSIDGRFTDFMKTLNGPGAISAKTKKLMAIALAAVTKCEPCLGIHIDSARAMGLTADEIDEAVWMAVSFGGAPIKMFYDSWKKNHNQVQ